ncbi:TPA: lytic polysaccharide monooxygenase [Providencia alcalifaciens]|uniref:Chitin binding domain protein n=2 Tax=Providencia alcalifaciens TaxID=126385 RepID=B6XHL3_9GAMM|nr:MULTISPECIES: lytic polysaccharide monooxygenase [Providencia]ATG17445.1 aminopeptidase [Providencia alcalifaciens]EEB44826.1 chitin binding domain protein [Providencia alcalifaciens DSM 30120]EKT66763.1 chitin-binding domain-containing protein [Providencia alcalifaciens Dmel2]EUD02394.1 chitin binding domain protein [Providencia alcalifaciens RIMD 1656011]MTC26876.1 aminopeptidase [Providencia alcalifaciens]
MKKLLLLPLLLCYSYFALPHGYIEYPASRAYLCKLQSNQNCGAVQYEPQSVEGLKGFPLKGPADGKIASANIASFSPLDAQQPFRWTRMLIETSTFDFFWRLTAIHRTTKWEYFITRKDWDPSKSLTRAQFELTPFCKFEKVEMPPSLVMHTCHLPKDYQGYHVVLGVWTIDDTANAFYQVIDLEIDYK